MSEITKKKNTRKIGDIGEKIAVKYLKSRDFTILETNYLKNWGELDIIAKNKNIIHFVEVKTHSYKTRNEVELSFVGDNWRPEEQVDNRKLHQIDKALQTWLVENSWKGGWQIDVIAVRMSEQDKYATINHFENVFVG